MSSGATGPTALAGRAETVERVARAAGLLGDRARAGVALAPMTTYNVGGPAALYAAPPSYEELTYLGEVIAATSVPVLVIGRGSNLLVADDGFPGLVISLHRVADRISVEDGAVRAGGAARLPVLARRTAAAGLSGLEWMVGVPGSVGGAVRMNAGGHGSDVAATLIEADVVDLRRGQRETVGADQLGLRFRGSALGDEHAVLWARFAVSPGERGACEREIEEIVRWRRAHQPGGQNCGSVFVNPHPGVLSAGRLIDELGLRGLRLGTAEVSAKHANFIQADPAGRAADVHDLIELVRAKVLAERGIALRSEVRMVGFAPGPDGEGDGR